MNLRRMEPQSPLGYYRWHLIKPPKAGRRRAARRIVENESLLRIACLQSVVRDPCPGARLRRHSAAVPPTHGLALRSISTRATLHARPRPKMAREARAGCWIRKLIVA